MPTDEMLRNLNPAQREEFLRLLEEPRAEHRIRLLNAGPHPLTTSPALVIKGDRVVAQALMSYAAPGTETDLTLTTAPSIRASHSEKETRRTADAAAGRDAGYCRVDLSGLIRVVNQGERLAELDVRRYVVGAVDSADAEGAVTKAPPGTLAEPWSALDPLNAVTRITWKLRLAPSEARELRFTWHYLTR